MVNVQSSSSAMTADIFRFFLSVCLCLTVCGCSFWQKSGGAENILPGTDPVSAERSVIREKNNTLVCLIAESGKPFSRYDRETGSWEGIEPEIIRALAENMNFSVQFIPLSRQALSGALRNGRGDIAAGRLSTVLIQDFYMTPVLPYAPADDKSDFALMVRPGDLQWAKDLEQTGKKIDLEKIVSVTGNTVKSATVQVLKQETKEISVSVDMGKKTEK